MLAEFTIIDDPLRPSVCTNLCSVCYRHEQYEGKGIGCCSYEPELCLFDLFFLYLYYPDIYEFAQQKGQIIKGYNGTMVEMKTGLNQCPFVGDSGCVLPRDALTPLCRLFICREAAIFAPTKFEERFDSYFTSEEYWLNQLLNHKLAAESNMDLNWTSLQYFIVNAAPDVETLIKNLDRTNPPIETFRSEINLAQFGQIP